MFKRLTTTLSLVAILTCTGQATADGHGKKLQIKKDGDRELVMIGDAMFTALNTKGQRLPYLYPIIGPTGAEMTRNYPIKQGVKGEATDHPHHISMWFAHGSVSGVNYWHNKKDSGTVQNAQMIYASDPSPRPVIGASDVWLKGNKEPLADVKTRYAFEVLADGSRVIDYTTSIAPSDGIEPLVFGDTKEGTMAIRMHPALRIKGEVATGKAINSEGHKDRDVWGKRAKWVAYWGQIDGKTCGIAIFDHPTNLRHPTWWHARDYGLFTANPFGMSDFERGKHKRGAGNHAVKAGEQLDLQYRFVFFAGTAEEADIANKYDQWVKDTKKAK